MMPRYQITLPGHPSTEVDAETAWDLVEPCVDYANRCGIDATGARLFTYEPDEFEVYVPDGVTAVGKAVKVGG